MRFAKVMAVRVLIADDHRLFAEALRAILAADRRIEVVGLAASGERGGRQAESSSRTWS